MGDKELCIICSKNAEKDDHLVSPQTYDSWQTLLEAAKIRCHDPIMDIAKLENYASILDGMNFVQRVKGDQATFGDIASAIFLMALKEGSHSKRIDIVFDTYQENSIKNSERSVRGEEIGYQFATEHI